MSTGRRIIGPLVAAGTLLGIGMGGFLDGIVFHQILQWHQMLSSWIPPFDLVSSKVNMVWDGLFHAVTWTTTMVGIALLWRATKRADVPRSNRVLCGSMALGWGAFNGVEGVVDHQILGVHHVHPGDGQLSWDLAFIASGVFLVVAGVSLVRAGRERAARS
ncbi:DUF2243 domain-containing protein [soil metagenome]